MREHLQNRWILWTFVLLLGAANHRAEAANPAGNILLVKGQVFIVDSAGKVVADPEGKRGRDTKPGSPFFVGETFQTKADGRVKLQFVEGKNEVVLGANTSLVIERASTDPNQKTGTSLNLARGEVRSDVKTKYSGQGSDVYEVKSKNAVAGVRGTIFSVINDEAKGAVHVFTQRGAVAVKAQGSAQSVLVKAGFASSVMKVADGHMQVTPPGKPSAEILSRVANLEGEGKASAAPASSEEGVKPQNENGKSDGAKNDGKADAAPKSDSAAADKPADKTDAKKGSAENVERKDDAKAQAANKGPDNAPPPAEAPKNAPAADSGSVALGREPVADAPKGSGAAGSALNRAPAGVMAPPQIMGADNIAAAPKLPIGMGPTAGLPTDLNRILSGTTGGVLQDATQVIQQKFTQDNTKGRVLIPIK